MKPYLHKAPTFRHPKTKARAMVFPIFGTDKYSFLERLFPSGYYLVQCYKGSELHDKIRCDDYRMAMDYYKAFSAIAKTA